MKARTVIGWTEGGFDRKLNEFLSSPLIEVLDVKFSSPIFFYSALVLYEDKE